MSDLTILVGAVLFAFGTPAVLLYLARGEGHGVGDGGDAGDEAPDGEIPDGEELRDDGATADTDQRTVGQYRRGRK